MPTVVHIPFVGSDVLNVCLVIIGVILLYRPVMTLIKKLPFL